MKSTTLPSDMLFEIFSRTSLKTLGRCRLASSFMQAFHQRTKTIYGFFTQASYVQNIKCQFVSTTNSPTYDCTVSLNFCLVLSKYKQLPNKASYYVSMKTTQEDIEYLNIMSASLAPKNGTKSLILKQCS